MGFSASTDKDWRGAKHVNLFRLHEIITFLNRYEF